MKDDEYLSRGELILCKKNMKSNTVKMSHFSACTRVLVVVGTLLVLYNDNDAGYYKDLVCGNVFCP